MSLTLKIKYLNIIPYLMKFIFDMISFPSAIILFKRPVEDEKNSIKLSEPILIILSKLFSNSFFLKSILKLL